jgi:hypothetical protein
MEAGFGGSPFRSGRPSHDVTTQLLQQGVVTSPDLPQEEAVHDPRRLDEMSERLPLAVGELRQVGAYVRRDEARGHRAQLGRRWSGRLLLHGSVSGESRAGGGQDHACDRSKVSMRHGDSSLSGGRTTALLRCPDSVTGLE